MRSLYVGPVNHVSKPTSIAVVVNPSKFDDPSEFTEEVAELFAEHGLPRPVFIETTVEDAGTGQAERALADGADMVVAAGGDGTVRMVAGALAGTSTEFGIIPVGTGNLMARNLEIPVDDLDGAVAVLADGARETIDLGWLSIDRGRTEEDEPADTDEEHPFLVISGVGFDAEVMADTKSRLKKVVGVAAYVLAGATRVLGKAMRVSLTLDGRREMSMRARTVMIGNVGRLPGGVTLMPGADATNGSLEILALNWRGPAGFAQIATELVLPDAPELAQISSSRTFQARRVTVSSRKSMPVQVDGDTLGRATAVSARVQPRALAVRIPRDQA